MVSEWLVRSRKLPYAIVGEFTDPYGYPLCRYQDSMTAVLGDSNELAVCPRHRAVPFLDQLSDTNQEPLDFRALHVEEDMFTIHTPTSLFARSYPKKVKYYTWGRPADGCAGPPVIFSEDLRALFNNNGAPESLTIYRFALADPSRSRPTTTLMADLEFFDVGCHTSGMVISTIHVSQLKDLNTFDVTLRQSMKPFVDYNSSTLVPLREFDWRRLRNIVVDDLAVTPAVADLLVPEGLFHVTFKTHERISGVAYVTSESVPLWFTLEKEIDDYIPTVYTLWKHPDLLPILSIPGKFVPAMLHGPFLSGSTTEVCFQSSASISTGKLVCVTQDYDPTASGKTRIGSALAVARMALPSHRVNKDTKGRVLTLLHAWKDQLWTIGGELRPPRPRLLDGGPNGEDDTHNEWSGEEIEAAAGTRSESTRDGITPKALSPEEVSNALKSALLASISTTLSKLPPGSFPVTPSVFYETYILPYRSSRLTKTTSTPVDIKHSEFRSLAVFLKASAKEGLIKIKENKGGMVVTGVDGSHPSVGAHVRSVTIKDVEVYKAKQEEAQAQEAGKAKMQHHTLLVTRLRKPGPISAPFFQRIGKDPEGFLTVEEIKTVVNKYLISRKLFNPDDQSSVNVAEDKFILDIVSNGKENKRVELLKRKFMGTNDVIGHVISSGTQWYKLSSGNRQTIISKGSPHPISIRAAHCHGHTVTYISSFEKFLLGAESLAEELKTACASSAAVQPHFCDPGLKQIMVQGEHVQVIKECLNAKGIEAPWIEVINHTGSKLKKKLTKEHTTP
ncbi:hypothetical protein BJ322DRAFT_1109804 [Thelephora terrestris]|uniref:SUI1 domain-containing protein n=1 Tax=Thelephora terrestris TaxID=56493 RepID=A0A9P6HCT1_9AGAM|nr:hypothetical protein BJ322DRAFT_1109804 [Thelephora terrestris]